MKPKFKFTEEMHEWIKEDIADIKRAIVLMHNDGTYTKDKVIKLDKLIEKFKLQLSAWNKKDDILPYPKG